jgi:phosphonopyruvate decarboxylase
VLSGTEFAALLERHRFSFATGVPCSLIETLIHTLEHDGRMPYVPAVREDVAVGLAAGAWLAGRRPIVLMQNSGLGTSMNALASMALMYGIPTLLLVTWRGYEGKDAPEHILTGAITPRHLELLGIPHRVLSAASAADDVAWGVAAMDRLSQPVALLVPATIYTDNTIYSGDTRKDLVPSISRYTAIRAAISQLGAQAVVHANGYPARESHAIADRAANFYMIGSMGLASAIGLGVALARPDAGTVVFDGDGNLLMNLGILPMVGARAPRNLVHVVFDNEVYGSTGNQGSPAPGVRLDLVAAGAGYRTVAAVTTEDEVAKAVAAAVASDGPHFILARVTPEQADVPRIAHTPAQIRDRFRAALSAA